MVPGLLLGCFGAAFEPFMGCFWVCSWLLEASVANPKNLKATHRTTGGSCSCLGAVFLAARATNAQDHKTTYRPKGGGSRGGSGNDGGKRRVSKRMGRQEKGQSRATRATKARDLQGHPQNHQSGGGNPLAALQPISMVGGPAKPYP